MAIMPKKTGVTLELLTDQNKFLLFEKGIRSGTCNVVQKYAVANNIWKVMMILRIVIL